MPRVQTAQFNIFIGYDINSLDLCFRDYVPHAGDRGVMFFSCLQEDIRDGGKTPGRRARGSNPRRAGCGTRSL